MTDTLDVAPGCSRTEGSQTYPEHARERLLTGGPSALEAAELVAILLGAPDPAGGAPAGGATPAGEPETAARVLLDRVGGLRSLASSTPLDLAAVPGVGDARAARIVASIELGRRLYAEPLPRGAYFRDGADIFRHYHAAMRELRVEQFRIVLLDGKHRFLREELISQGTLTSSPVHPREVFAPAIRHSAAAVVL